MTNYGDGTMNEKKGFEKLLQEIEKTTGDIWLKGWAERNAGNISVRLRADQVEKDFNRDGKWYDIGASLPDVAGGHFLFSGTGAYLRNVEIDPACNLGVIEIDPAGDKYRPVWGFTSGGSPTSELLPHLRSQIARKRVTNGSDCVVMHTHPPNIIALTYAMDLDAVSLTRLLWEMHTECIAVFPRGCGVVHWRVPGSDELAKATAEILEKRTIAVWQFHGIVAVGPDLDTAFGLIDTAEKAAQIHNIAAGLGPIKNKLTTEQLAAMAKQFNAIPDPEILNS